MNNFFEWDQATLSVHVPKMDAEHRAIITCVNKLHSLHKAKVSGPQLVNTVIELGNITVRHFADEEAYMKEIGFPGLSNHALIHKNCWNSFPITRSRQQQAAPFQKNFSTS